MNAPVGELFISLGIAPDLVGIRNAIGTITATFTGLQYGLSKLFDSTTKQASSLQNFELQTGLSIQKLQELQQIAQSVNLNIGSEDVMRDVINLQKIITDLKLGVGDITPFRLAGINPFGGAFSVIDQLRDVVKNLDNTTATNLIQRMGLNPNMISVLKVSNEEFKKLSQNFFLDKTQLNDVTELGKTIKQITLNFIALKDQAIAKLSPELNNLMKNFFQWMKDNGTQIIETIANLTKTLANLMIMIGRVFSMFADGMNIITNSKNGMQLLTTSILVLGLSFKPVLLGFWALMEILEDIAVWRKGGDSLLGGLYDTIGEIPDLSILLGIGTAVLGITQYLIPALEKVAVRAAAISGTGILKGISSKIGLPALAIGGAYGAYEAYKHKDEISDWFLGHNSLSNNNMTNTKNNNTTSNTTNNVTINVNSNSTSPKSVADELADQIRNSSLRFSR